MPTRYQRISDSGHPTTELFAEDLYVRTPASDWPAGVPPKVSTWEHESVDLRDAFRARARRFMLGDLSVLPWTHAIGTAPREQRGG